MTVLGYTYPGSSCAPSLLIGLINMFMFESRGYGYVKADGTPKQLCYLNYWYPGQVCAPSPSPPTGIPSNIWPLLSFF